MNEWEHHSQSLQVMHKSDLYVQRRRSSFMKNLWQIAKNRENIAVVNLCIDENKLHIT
jgi:hypothetical protein